MNILVLNWQDINNPLAGGAEVHLHEVFSRIVRRGHRVTLFCSAFPGCRPEETLDGIRVLRGGSRHLFNFVVPAAYGRRFRHAGFDVVVDDMNKIPFFTPLFVREPLLCVTHHLFDRSIFKETNPLIASYVYIAERRAVSLLASRRTPFIVGSPSTRAELIARGCREEDVSVVHYAVDHERYRPSGVPRNPTPLIGYFGRLKRYKSVDHLLFVMPVLLRQMPSLRLVIVGDGDDRSRLESIARDLGIGPSVEFTGFVSEQRKVELMQQVWCKVTTSSKEGWGLTVLEANACGTTVIASNVPGLRDAVKDGETGLLYRYGDREDLARNVTRVLTDTVLRETLTRNALLWAADFTWDRAAEQTLALLSARASHR